MFSSTRYPGSAKELSNVPNFSEDDPQYVPPDSWFLLHRVCLVIGLYYLNTFYLDIRLRLNQALLADIYIPFLLRITSVSVEKVITRVQVSVAY